MVHGRRWAALRAAERSVLDRVVVLDWEVVWCRS
jgi:hypothetical protein